MSCPESQEPCCSPACRSKLAYFIAIVYVIITFSLLRVQEALEDPFDGMGS
jgi:hypothetical protein